MGKLEYAQYIQKIPYIKGDYLIHKSAEFPVDPNDIWKITDIQEIHYLCEGNKDDQTPRPIQCKNRNGTVIWINHNNMMRIVLDKESQF